MRVCDSSETADFYCITDGSGVSSSRPPPCDVIVEYHLEILVSLDLGPGGVVRGWGVRVHVHQLPVPLVLEEQANLAVGDDLEIWRWAGR